LPRASSSKKIGKKRMVKKKINMRKIEEAKDKAKVWNENGRL